MKLIKNIICGIMAILFIGYASKQKQNYRYEIEPDRIEIKDISNEIGFLSEKPYGDADATAKTSQSATETTSTRIKGDRARQRLKRIREMIDRIMFSINHLSPNWNNYIQFA